MKDEPKTPGESTSSKMEPPSANFLEERKRARRLSITNRELLIAVNEVNLEKIGSLIRDGADVNFKDREGNTPLHWAVESNDLKTIRLLLNKGAVANTKNNKNITPKAIAWSNHRRDIVQVLELAESKKLLNDIQPDGQKRINQVRDAIYQLKVLMLFLYRGILQGHSFRLRTNGKEDNKFDDLVFECNQNHKKVYKIIHVKHRFDESEKILSHSLLNKSAGDYSLIKYFFFYLESKKLFKDGSLKEITICTSLNFDFENLENEKIDIKKMNNKDNVVDVESNKKKTARYKLTEKVAPLLKQKLQDYSTIKYSDEDLKDFLNHLVFAVNQPNINDIERTVKKEIGKEFEFILNENEYNIFVITMLKWLQNEAKFISHEKGKQFFEEARTNIPILYIVREPVESFTGRVEQLLNLHKTLQGDEVPKVVCISGLGGVGKTELVRKYISEYSQCYDNKIAWINAENYQSLAESFRDLAYGKLRLDAKDTEEDDKGINSIVDDVYKFFSNGRSLFIFDNAEKYKSQNDFDCGIDKFLLSLSANYSKMHVLITSRNPKWPKNIKVLPLDAFTEEEATEYIKKSLNIENDTLQKDVKDLGAKLQLFPLALKQVIAYIKVQQENIVGYLKKYEEKRRDLIAFDFPRGVGNDFSKTIFTTWNVTLDAISKKENGKEALDILNIISYLAPENIPTEIFLSFVDDQNKLESAIELLKQYSIINVERKGLSVHRLIQHVTRFSIRKQFSEKDVLGEALNLFTEVIISSKNVDHAISVWNHSIKHSDLIEEFAQLSSDICISLINSARYEEANSFGLNVIEVLKKLVPDNSEIQLTLLLIKKHMATVLLEQGKYDASLKAFQDIFKIQKNIFVPEHPRNLDIQSCLASVLSKQGKVNEALKYYEKILDIRTNALGENDPDTLSTKHDIAGIFLSQGRFNEALEMLQKILKTEEVILGKDHTQTIRTKNSVACAFMNLDKYDDAIQMFQEILTIRKNVWSEHDPCILDTKSNIAGVLLKQGKYSEALQIYQEVYDAEKTLYTDNHPKPLSTFRHIAELMRLQCRYDEALEILDDIYDKQKNTLGTDHPESISTQCTKGLTFDSMRRFDDALKVYDKVLIKRKELFGSKHPNTLRILNHIAVTLSKKGQLHEALSRFQEILDIQKSTLGENHPDTLATKHNMGSIYLDGHRYDKALEFFQEVLDQSEKFIPNHPDTLSTKASVGLVLLCQQKLEDAMKIFREVLDAQRAIFGEEHSETMKTKNNIALTLMARRNYSEALQLAQEVFHWNRKVYGPNHQQTLKVNNMINSLSKIVDLLTAVKEDNLKEVQNLVNSGKDVNTSDDEGKTLLHCAVNNGNLAMVTFLLKNGAAIERTTNKGNTPLHTAAVKGHARIAETLLQNVHPDKRHDFVDARTTTSSTSALHVAAKSGNVVIAKILLRHGATYCIRNDEGKRPADLSSSRVVTRLLHWIEEMFEHSRTGNEHLVSTFKVLQPDELELVTNVRDEYGHTILINVFSVYNHENIAMELTKTLLSRDELRAADQRIGKDSELQQLQSLKRSAEVYLDFSKMYLNILRSMSEPFDTDRNAHPWRTLKEGSYLLGNAYHLAMVYNECPLFNDLEEGKIISSVMAVLKDLQYDPKHVSYGYTKEAYGGDTKCFVSKGQGAKYYEMLHSELKKDVQQFVELVERELDAPIRRFHTGVQKCLQTLLPEKLFEATKQADCARIRDCLERGADVDAEDADGRTPLHYAVHNGRVDIVKELLEHGADVTHSSTNKGNTPLHTAASRGHSEIVDLLLQHVSFDRRQAFADAKTTSAGSTALHVAAKSGYLKVVKSLLKHGATYSLRNNEGKRPVDLTENKDVTKLLNAIDQLFDDAKNGEVRIINKLTNTTGDEFEVVTNARNEEGNTLFKVAIINKYQHISHPFVKILKERAPSK